MVIDPRGRLAAFESYLPFFDFDLPVLLKIEFVGHSPALKALAVEQNPGLNGRFRLAIVLGRLGGGQAVVSDQKGRCRKCCDCRNRRARPGILCIHIDPSFTRRDGSPGCNLPDSAFYYPLQPYVWQFLLSQIRRFQRWRRPRHSFIQHRVASTIAARWSESSNINAFERIV